MGATRRVTRHYLRIFRWHVLRYVARHRLLALLNIASVALGVAVYLAIQIANGSANRAFAASVDVVAGKAELRVRGGVGGLPDEVFPAVARQPGVAAATPLVRGIVTLPDFPGEYLQILGVDIFTNTPFRTFELTNFDAHDFDIQRWLGDPETVAISEEFARLHNLQAGDSFRIQVNAVDRTLRVSFVLRSSGIAAADPHFAAMDIGWAQELLVRRGSLSSIQLQLAPKTDRETAIAKLRAVLPADATVAAPAQRNQEVENMLRGFELNLTAMSLVSLLVGMFLIYNTVSASVVRRRSEIGILRSLGVTRNEVRALFLFEALAFGAAGTLLGLFAGVLLARALVGTVSETISTLYVLVSVTQLATTPAMFVFAAAAGLISVVLAAWLPSAAAAKMDPVRALRAGSIIEQSAELSPMWFWSGVATIVLAIALSIIALTTGPAWIGFGAAFCVLAGFSFLVPETTKHFSAGLGALLPRKFLTPSLAAGNLRRSLARNAITIAALAAAVAMAIGVSVMVFSFRRTVGAWIEQTLVADLFVAPASNEVVGPTSFMPRAAIQFFETHPDVVAVDTFREVEIAAPDKSIAVAVVRGGERRHFQFLRGDSTAIMRRFLDEQCALISEAFARKNGVHDGDELELITPEGPHRFPIAGTFYDYTRDEGLAFLSAKTFVALWKDDRVNSAAVYLKPGASATEVTAQFRREFSGSGQFMVLSNRELRTRIFEIFDQTFAVTYVLRTIAVIVAIVGICLTLTILIAERTRELAVFRAIGGSAGQLRKVLLWECALLGLLAAIVGVASGLCLSFVLTGVINRAFFGWTIQLAIPWSSLAVTPFWIVAAAVVAGIIPAVRAGRLVLAEALRSE